jgi:hypothetical protein
MKFEALATAAFLTSIIAFAIPAKANAETLQNSDRTQDQIVAAANLGSTQITPELKAATELQFTTYNPYPFGTVDGIVIISRQHGIGCLVGSQDATDGTVFCGLIDND